MRSIGIRPCRKSQQSAACLMEYLGPDGGDKGGEIVVVGTSETVVEHSNFDANFTISFLMTYWHRLHKIPSNS